MTVQAVSGPAGADNADVGAFEWLTKIKKCLYFFILIVNISKSFTFLSFYTPNSIWILILQGRISGRIILMWVCRRRGIFRGLSLPLHPRMPWKFPILALLLSLQFRDSKSIIYYLIQFEQRTYEFTQNMKNHTPSCSRVKCWSWKLIACIR